MATEMHISDILCEAMEYLSKLGSNLRTRSENLKEKRISKTKLKNTHAVQKAANKVLLICELSKKSLDNVESGVRNVLSMIDAAQGLLNSDEKSKRTRHQNYHYFEYNSQRLRIAQKILLEHYMSAKVVASRMPTSVQEHYPVYYNCKLKRRRRRENLHKLEAENKTPHSPSDTEQEKEKSEFDNKQLPNSQNEDDEHNMEPRDTSHVHSEDESIPDNELQNNLELDTSNKNICNETMECEDNTSINIVDNSNLEVHNKTPPGSLPTVNEENNLEPDNAKLIFTDTDDDSKKPLESDITQTINKCQIDLEKNCESDSDSASASIANKSSEDSKPLIRCVNLSKLLKPNLVTDTEMSSNKSESIKTKSPTSKNNTAKHKHDKPLKNKQTVHNESLMQKRKEVAEFKAKEFSIKVLRLPDLTKSFLIVHKLKRIIKTGDVICEISDTDVSSSKKIKEVKNALLNDSESDECDETNSSQKSQKVLECQKGSDSETSRRNVDKAMNSLANGEEDQLLVNTENKSRLQMNANCESIAGRENTPDCENDSGNNIKQSDTTHPNTPGSNKVKQSLLKDSSDEQEDKAIEETPTKTNARLKSSLLNDSSAEEATVNNNAILETPTKTNAKIKSSLLNDSSDIKSDSDHIKEKRKTPKSKLKRVRKNREARMRLHYGTSSDSEQEQHKHKRSRLKSKSSASSSSEDLTRIRKRKQIPVSDSDSNTNKNDDPDNVHSFSSAKKMVRSKSKPSGSSSQVSDNQDPSDKDIDGLANLNSLNKNRRSSKDKGNELTNNHNDNVSDIKISLSKTLGEELLKAEATDESSSNASHIDGSDYGEELPVVPMTGLNGDSVVDHLAKDDLLGETESSCKSHSENTDNMDDTDEGAKVKSKRRKVVLSSDSEGGSNRKKRDGDKLSDFEDSEEDTSETGKKVKRKKKVTDSDASQDSNEAGQKKRRRIKQLKDSDASDSDSDNEGRNKHGRKNIRKVKGKNQLEEATKRAAREEKERIARITERQKMYNNLDFDESGKPDEVVLDKVVLDFDPETKEPLIQVDRGLVKKLKPHQANGIKFMWDACFESVKQIKKAKGSGCILAHCMGLGKTLQVISLTHTLLTHGDLTGVNRVLVVCPLSTVLNWVNEFNIWLEHAETEFDVDVYELSRYKQNSERAYQLTQWFEGGGVCVLGYEMFRNLSADNSKKFKKKMLRNFQESLVDPGPDLVICDEGHLLKNEKTSLSQSMNRVKTARRIVLTGTPLQNNLKEYYCMVQFVKPNLLGKYNEYLNRFVNPITNGQYTDSTEHDIRIMKRRSHVLHKMLDGAVQRRDYGVLAPFLPPKHEYVLFITLSDVQIKLYEYYLEHYSRKPMSGRTGFLFPDFQSLQRIWTHPLVLKYNSERYEIMQQKKREREEEEESDGSRGSLDAFIDDDSTPEETSTEESTEESSDASDDSRKKKKKKISKKKDTKISTRRGTRANPVAVEDDLNKSDDVVEIKNDNPTEWWIKLVEEEELDDMRNSHKLVLLFDILRQCENIGDKLLVFSQSLYSLDLIEHFLQRVDEATQEGRIDEKLGGHVGSWSQGVDYFRLDGSTSCENRSIWCKNFNAEDNPRARLFLISTRAGGLGINLVAANRVVIFDVSWNPSHDVQSIFRVYRFGQKKPCYVYRFLAMGTMEEKIYERQVTKQAISKRVIDEQQIDRHYAENDLAELYKFQARPEEPRPTPPLPKDRLFAEILKEHELQIYKYHEHDSLLENKEEETLSEEERKAAWDDFENEKTRPPPTPFGPSPWAMHNGLLAQQQQQMAYTALVNLLRNDIPNINDNQIRELLSSGMLNSPAMLQKMSEIYKYMPNMINPAMMNSMNSGSGSSGLQYEPPWQRQHQQQQQMRLQQILQHQNPLGVKLYAGGLGSRDPVAMTLQQQRAREIMMGGSAGGGGSTLGSRPRGRPPTHTRMPTTSQDVVNLDSD